MKKVIVVMPAYYAEKTLEATYDTLPKIYGEIILCDDGSIDATADISRRLGITTLVHTKNTGYGGNQKTLYRTSLEHGADAIVMVHPDNQYDTTMVSEMLGVIGRGEADFVLGSRMQTALQNGMPYWKYTANRFLTWLQNLVFRSDLSEFHSGLRVYRADIFRDMPFETFSDHFVFDSEVIAWCFANKHAITEVPTVCRYTDDVSSIGLWASIRYGCATLWVLVKYCAGKYRNG